jgi:hypothetical protein
MQKSNLWAAIIISMAVIAPLGALYVMNRPVESRITNFEECAGAGYTVLESDPRKCITPEGKAYTEVKRTCSDDSGCAGGFYCRRAVCEEFSPDADCSTDSGCALINTRNMLSCCWRGRCDAVDYSLPEWTAVSATWLAAEKAISCPAECGPAPMCPQRIVNADYSAKCVNGTCHKVEKVQVGMDISCATDPDCVIKSIDGACGPYPLCVNRDYEPQPQETSTGESGACGYTDIDGCLCESGLCVGTMQGNRV